MEDIYGTNLGSLKEKTVSRNNRHVSTEVNVVPRDIMDTYHVVTIAIDIMFINAIPFFITVSRSLKFGKVKRLPNRQIQTLKRVLHLYELRRFQVITILADPEFQPLHATFLGQQLYCFGADEHVPKVEHCIT